MSEKFNPGEHQQDFAGVFNDDGRSFGEVARSMARSFGSFMLPNDPSSQSGLYSLGPVPHCPSCRVPLDDQNTCPDCRVSLE